MRDGADVIVVGGGIIGCAIARELAFAGRAGSALRGSHGRGGRDAGVGGHPGAVHRGPRTRAALRPDAAEPRDVRRLRRARDRRGRRSTSNTGAAARSKSRQTTRRLTPSAARPRRPAPQLQWLDASETRRLEPALPDSIRGAILAPSHGYVAVSSLTEALVWAALRHGAELETGRHVRTIQRQADDARR